MKNTRGLIYHSDIFERIALGDKKIAYVKTIRKDGNIDLALREPGSKKSTGPGDKVFNILKENKGSMPYTIIKVMPA